MAGSRPTDWHVLDLDKDPTPGDPDRVRTLAKGLHDFADDVAEALRLIKGMAEEDTVLVWAGKSAKAFQDEFSGVPKNLRKLKKSYEMAGDALAAYWPKLERAQALADKALVKGREAQTDLSSAQSKLTSAESWVDRAGKEADKYKDDPTGGKDVPKPDPDKVKAATRDAQSAKDARSSAQSDVTSAGNALDAAKKMAGDARKMREDAAREAKDKLDDASDAGIHNRKWWEEVGDWFTDNWDTIVAVCKVVVAVLGIIALIIGGPILGAIVLIAALIVLADTLNKYFKGQASLWDVGFAALDCIPGMKGLTSLRGLAKGLKGLSKIGLKGMALGAKGLGPKVKSLGRQMKNLFTCGDPIDVATGQMVMSIPDITLPGVLPLVVERSHRTGVRNGRWFGPDWTSTLDQRLLADSDGIRFIAEDGTVLYYAVPEPDAPMYPVAGPRWPLRWDGVPGSEMTVEQPEAGRTLQFRALPGDPSAAAHVLTGVHDRNGNAWEVRHSETGAPSELVHHGGYHIGVTCEDDRITAFTLLSAPDRPRLLDFGYDADGRLDTVTDSSGIPQRYAYDHGQRVSGWQSRDGSWYRYLYDDADRCVGSGGTEGVLAYAYRYDENARTTVATNSLGHSVTYGFDKNYRPVTETDALGATALRGWDEDGRLTSLTDPLGRTTRFAHDPVGNVTEIVGADSSVIAREYNDLRQVTKVTQADGGTWESVYDSRGNRLAVIDPSGARTSYTYDDRGGLTGVVDPLGRRQETAVNDAAGLVTGTTGALGGTNTFVRDAFGRITELTDAFGAVTRVGWTREGRISWRELPQGTVERWTYDAEGNPLSFRSSTGRHTTYRNTHFDLCSEREDEDGTLERFTYDTELRLTSVTNAAGHTWSYAYDPLGRLTAETDFNGRTLTYGYDAAGQLVERTNGAGQTTRLRYDVLGNVTAMDADGATTTYAYDPLGRLIGARNADGELGLEHDAVGRVTGEHWNGRRVGSRYDMTGRRTERTTPSGAVTRWTYEPERRSLVQRMGTRDVTFRYDIAGQEIERLIGDAVRLTHHWDSGRLRTTQRLTSTGGDVRGRVFNHRADGALTGISELGDGRAERAFEFDGAGRVVAVRGGAEETYDYDALGNLTHFGTSGTVRDQDQDIYQESGPGDRTYSGTLIERAGRTFYRHDGQGRVTERVTKLLSGGRRVWRYAWNAEDQLTDVLTPDGRHWHYAYDPLGRRTAKQLLDDDGTTVAQEVSFHWDGDLLVEQTDGAVSTSWDFDDGHHPVGQRVRVTGMSQAEIDERFYAIVTDLIGTPTELVDADGDIVWERSSTLWGLPTGSGDGDRVDCPLRFPGQYHDAETGLHYNHHRYYEPGTARYLSPDPLGRTPAPNQHAYVKNPLQWTDPLGLKAPCMVDLYHGTFGSAADNIMKHGIDINLSQRKMDFGKGGFYVTNDPKQALDWAKNLATRNSDVPAVIHFRVPKAQLDSLNSKIFNGPGDDVADFIRHHRNGGAMHGYEMVEGPMLLNLKGFLKGGKPPVLEGHQIAIFGDRAAELFSNSIHRRVGPSTS
ncbi:RHS repeat-associated core domain-containing protein [Streptomyces sp. NPDC058001]|uniref:RHS repeat-associated core domain-containing protein n=1 Tax=Streptomyces sp. NPDC058001 TaxID=3346300 RepID=UPI0036E1A0AF